MAVQTWMGPDVLVIGWVPFQERAPWPTGYPRGRATKLLFQAGNPDPPVKFGGFAGFADWAYPLNPVGTREYRVALSLSAVRAEFAPGARPRIFGAPDALIGFTPFRLLWNGRNLADLLPQFAAYDAGIGRVGDLVSAVDPAGEWVEMRFRVEFKLAWLGNLVGRLLTGAWAPHAWCEVRYHVDRSGGIVVRVQGSAVPSQRLYVDWDWPGTTSCQYDMRRARRKRVNGFLKKVGWGCRPAPRTSQLHWRGQATA